MSDYMQSEPRPLHLHSVQSLCVDLINGKPVLVGDDREAFALSGPDASRLLGWYMGRHGRWAAPVTAGDAESLVDSILTPPTQAHPVSARHPGSATRRLRLVRIEAHRFAGIHSPTTGDGGNFVFEPIHPVTLFEGLNGSGKTSLLSSVIWALTGQILRPQRMPEPGTTEFLCDVAPVARGDDGTVHRLSAVTPLPTEKPSSGWVDASTWVELTFVDEAGTILPPLRRTQSRTARGKLEENVTNLDSLGVDPAGLRVGTVMPGMLAFIQVGTASELGRAVAELTGLSDIVLLSGHAGRAKNRIDGESSKARKREIDSADAAYGRVRDAMLQAGGGTAIPDLAMAVPPPSGDPSIEGVIGTLAAKLEAMKATALRDAREVLGAGFNADDRASRDDLVANVRPALGEVRQLGRLPSATRLAALGKLTAEELIDARVRIAAIVREAAALARIEADLTVASRIRLYARVAAWHAEHPHDRELDSSCIVCGSDLEGVLDPTTGLAVAHHMLQAAGDDAALLSQTIGQWSETTRGALARDLPGPLRISLTEPLPDHPGDLVRESLCTELFQAVPFGGVLGSLKPATLAACNAELLSWPALAGDGLPELGGSLPATGSLRSDLRRLDLALRFAAWRQEYGALVVAMVNKVVGTGPDPAPSTLGGKLLGLQATVDAAEPLTAALGSCSTLLGDLARRRAAEARLAAYTRASIALKELMGLGSLAQRQVDSLQSTLAGSAAKWRGRIYSGAFPSTGHELVGTAMGSSGEIDLKIGTGVITAPAQHVANASALKAALFGFFLAYWEHLMRERGGLQLLILDDPQELLDEENRERLALAFVELRAVGAQILVTTYDRRFAASVADLGKKGVAIDHRSVHPATVYQPTLQIPVSVTRLTLREEQLRKDPNDVGASQDYASECRVFIETRLGELFDNATHPAWSTSNHSPALVDHLARLRGLVNRPPGELFRGRAFADVCADPALADGSPTLALLNKAHHRKHEIRPSDVSLVFDHLVRLRKLVERAHEEFRRWKQGAERGQTQWSDMTPLRAVSNGPLFSVDIYPDLAALVGGDPTGLPNDTADGMISSQWLGGKSLFYIRSDNLGFQLPKGSVAVVETESDVGSDRDIVIARHRDTIRARRLLSARGSGTVALAAEKPDPRNSPPTMLIPSDEVDIHRVVGAMFDHQLLPPPGRGEAVQIEELSASLLVEVAFRVRGESAVPLALPGQVVLAGPALGLDTISVCRGCMAAIVLDDGSGVFKRIADALPAPLAHLRQFESVGGLGDSQVFAVGKPQPGFREVTSARLIVGVVYGGF